MGFGRDELVDPDPFTVAAVSMAAISLIVQFAQAYKAFRPAEPPDTDPVRARLDQLELLEQGLDDVTRRLARTLTAIDRATQSSELEFYEAPVRVGKTKMLMSNESLYRFGGAYAELVDSLSTMARWINHTLAEDPVLASRLGARMTTLDESAARINRAMAEGRATREVIEECKIVLDQFAGAVEAELRGTAN